MRRQMYDVSPKSWSRYMRSDIPLPVAKGPKYGISVDFPISPLPDPRATGPWLGYLESKQIANRDLRLPGKPIVGSTLVYEFQIIASSEVRWNFMSDANNLTGQDPAGFRPMIRCGHYENYSDTGRWWSDSRFELRPCGLTRFEVSLDPARWFSVYGGRGNEAGYSSYFKDAINRPTHIGLTFGGGHFAGHGVNVSRGKASFNLIRVYSQ